MTSFLSRWLHRPLTAENLDGESLYAALVNDTVELLSNLPVVAFSGCVFALGGKLAWQRQHGSAPDMETLAELQAVYRVLQNRGMPYFAAHTTMDYAEMQALLATGGTDDPQDSPPDVTLMSDIYNAVWALHYRDFRQDAARALADWNATDAFQNRAMRAVLCDIEYPSLVQLAVVVFLSDTRDASKPVVDSVHKKQEILLDILGKRQETPAEMVKILRGDTQQMVPLLAAWVKKLDEMPREPFVQTSLFGDAGRSDGGCAKPR